MGSSLSEQERIGLEEAFLSISPPRNITQKWSNWGRNFIYSFNIKNGSITSWHKKKFKIMATKQPKKPQNNKTIQ